ncbi:MAG: hypothetical protein WKF58_15810 [Ilumatobacteraceae bacterium]
MNRQIRQLAAGFMALYIGLFAALNWWQVERKEELDAKVDNKRAIVREVQPAPRPHRHRRRRHRRRIRHSARRRRVRLPAPLPHRRPVRQRHRLLLARQRLDPDREGVLRRPRRHHRGAASARARRADRRPRRQLGLGPPEHACRPATGRQGRARRA